MIVIDSDDVLVDESSVEIVSTAARTGVSCYSDLGDTRCTYGYLYRPVLLKDPIEKVVVVS